MFMHFEILPVLPAWGCGFPSGLVAPTLTCIPLRTRVWPHLAQVAVFSIVRTVAPQEQKGKRNCCGALKSDGIRTLVIAGAPTRLLCCISYARFWRLNRGLYAECRG